MAGCLITIIHSGNGVADGWKHVEGEFAAMIWINDQIKHSLENHPFTYRLKWDDQTREVTVDDFLPVENRYGAWQDD